MENLIEFLENFSVVELQNATLYYKKEIIKKTLRTLSTPNARRKYLKQLGIRFDDKKHSFSGGATDVELEYLLCPITRKIFVEPVVAENGVTYEKSALISQSRRAARDRPLRFVPNNVMRNMVFRLKSEIPNDDRVRRFFERHWNNELIAQLGLDINPPGNQQGARMHRWVFRLMRRIKVIKALILLIVWYGNTMGYVGSRVNEKNARELEILRERQRQYLESNPYWSKPIVDLKNLKRLQVEISTARGQLINFIDRIETSFRFTSPIGISSNTGPIYRDYSKRIPKAALWFTYPMIDENDFTLGFPFSASANKNYLSLTALDKIKDFIEEARDWVREHDNLIKKSLVSKLPSLPDTELLLPENKYALKLMDLKSILGHIIYTDLTRHLRTGTDPLDFSRRRSSGDAVDFRKIPVTWSDPLGRFTRQTTWHDEQMAKRAADDEDDVTTTGEEEIFEVN